MIFDMRTYVCRPGTIAAHLKVYEQYGWGPQTKHLGQPVFYAVTETGVLRSEKLARAPPGPVAPTASTPG